MTLAELQTKRDEILASIGIARTQLGDGRGVDYSKQQDALALIDAEIARVQVTAGASVTRTSYIQHSRE